jgi:hypothetical protein
MLEDVIEAPVAPGVRVVREIDPPGAGGLE